MREILKILFEYVTGCFSLFDNAAYNQAAMGVIGIIAFAIAFGTVKGLYQDGVIEGGTIGSIIHYVVRGIVFIALFLAFTGIVWICRLAIQVPVWVWITLAVTAIAVAIMLAAIKHFRELQKCDHQVKGSQ